MLLHAAATAVLERQVAAAGGARLALVAGGVERLDPTLHRLADLVGAGLMLGDQQLGQTPDTAREIALRIENELKYPGEIRVNVIRESRTIEYAR